MRRLTDGERQIMAEAERDARECEESMAMDEKPGEQAWYLAEAIPRLKRLDELSPLCNWGNPVGLTVQQQNAREEWRRLMDLQNDAEIRAGM